MLTAIVIIFIAGYLAIALEHQIHVNKAATALLMGSVCWALYALGFEHLLPLDQVPAWFVEEANSEGIAGVEVARSYLVDGQFLHLVAETAYILFFLMGAMTIVELVDVHEGFSLITDRIQSREKVTLLWVIAWLTFFVSAILDNLTTTIVMVSLLRKVVSHRDTRLLFMGVVVIAANAGGAWTVIGDVTTTMLWIKHKITTVAVMRDLLVPSIACLLVPLLVISRALRGELDTPAPAPSTSEQGGIQTWHRALFLGLGLFGLLSVPAFKAYTHLPPFVGMMVSLSVLWFVSEMVGHTLDEEVRSTTGVVAVLKRVDMSTILFFLGILLAVGSLSATGLLGGLAAWLDQTVASRDVVAVVIGLVSAVVDNVPLVAAGIEMYQMPADDRFWMLLALCAGTGGSCLIIGSAAGVAAMGLERINFIWYATRIAPLALLGYLAGVGMFLLLHAGS